MGVSGCLRVAVDGRGRLAEQQCTGAIADGRAVRFAQVAPEIDEYLRLTPSERLQRMQAERQAAG